MDGRTAQQRYEEGGQRPGTKVATRLDDDDLKALDKARGAGKRNAISRGAWLLKAIRAALGRSEEED